MVSEWAKETLLRIRYAKDMLVTCPLGPVGRPGRFMVDGNELPGRCGAHIGYVFAASYKEAYIFRVELERRSLD